MENSFFASAGAAQTTVLFIQNLGVYSLTPKGSGTRLICNNKKKSILFKNQIYFFFFLIIT